MNKFNYILNDIAFDTYVIKCLYGEPTDEDLRICENQIKLLQQKYKQLLTNWNELKKWLEEELKEGRSTENQWLMGCYDQIKEILDKMQELEGKSE